MQDPTAHSLSRKQTLMMIKRIATVAAAASAAVTLAAAPALAYTLDSAGTGFVSKNEVSTALGGLNNAQMNALTASFSFHDTVEYDVPCMKENTRQTLRNTFDRSRSVTAAVVHETRNNKKGNLTGYKLTGLGAETIDGNVVCPGGWEADGAPVEVESSGGVLKVNGAEIVSQ